MSQAPTTLAQLRQERDHAWSCAMDRLQLARQSVENFDKDVVSLVSRHPVLALGGAVVVGAAAGLMIGARPIRLLAKATALAIARPVAVDLIQKLVGSFEANWNNSG